MLQNVLALLDSRVGLPPQPAALQGVLRALGNPQAALRCIHVAGTNGKGSTAVMLANILKHAGYRTGLFTSPHISHFTERIQVDGAEIAEEALLNCCEAVLRAEAQAGVMLNYFSLATMMALLHFHRQGCDYAVLEAGLGGRLDPTNCIPKPMLCILTQIGMDHMSVLGDTLPAIAAEKAGIIKQGCDVVTAPQPAAAMQVIQEVSLHQGAALYEAQPLVAHIIEGKLLYELCHSKPYYGVPSHGLSCYDSKDMLELGLSGSYQAENAAVVLLAARVLREKHAARIGEGAIREGLRSARWPARFEQLSGVLLDGAHNPDGAAAFARSIVEAYPGKRCVFVMAFMRDKDIEDCIHALAPLSLAMVAVPMPHERSMPVNTLRDTMKKMCKEVYTAKSIHEGLSLARERARDEAIVAACGSLYMADAVREWAKG